MFRFTLFAIALVAFAAIGNSVSGAEPDAYTFIDNYLEENVASETPELIMQIIEDLLESDQVEDQELAGALDGLISLKDLSQEYMCNSDGLQILIENGDLIRDHTDAGHKLDTLIHHYEKQHAKLCEKVHLENYASSRERIDADLNEYVDQFIGAIVDDELAKLGTKDARHLLKREGSHKMGENEAKRAHEMLKLFARDDENRRYLDGVKPENQDKVYKLFDEYLVEPCDYFTQELGDDIFSPAEYSAKLLPESERYNLDTSSDFYRDWAKFRLCTELLGPEHDELANEIIMLASGSSH